MCKAAASAVAVSGELPGVGALAVPAVRSACAERAAVGGAALVFERCTLQPCVAATCATAARTVACAAARASPRHAATLPRSARFRSLTAFPCSDRGRTTSQVLGSMCPMKPRKETGTSKVDPKLANLALWLACTCTMTLHVHVAGKRSKETTYVLVRSERLYGWLVCGLVGWLGPNNSAAHIQVID